MKNNVKFSFTVEDETIKVMDTAHSIERFSERLIVKNMSDSQIRQKEFAIYSMIVSIGDNILDAKNGEVFGIYDSIEKIGVICSITSEFYKNEADIYLDLITVVHTDKFFVKKGQKVLNVNELLSAKN